MNLLTLENISKNYSEKILLNDISLGINEGDKIGIIGINGAGKSTLLNILAGKDEFFDGKRIVNRNIKIEFLSQNEAVSEELSILEQVFKSDNSEMKLLLEYENLIEDINSGKSSDHDKLLKLQTQIDNLNLWSLENEAKNILNKLGITNYSQKMKNLSGGQRKRVFLAATLIKPCDLLILDEPTNHLDSKSIEWLEEYLNKRKGSLVMITHDRYFLDRVTNRILELDRGTLYSYVGNYTKYLDKKIERLEIEKSAESKRQSLIRTELKWIKRGAKARSTKQKARIQRFEDLVSTEYNEVNTDIEINYVGSRLGKKIVEINNISKSFGDRHLINDFSYIFTREDRIGIVGDNGVGKSTFLSLLEDINLLDAGTIEIGETVKIGVFSQEGKELNLDSRVIDFVKEGGEYIPTNDGSKISASTLCERFLFDSSTQYSKIEKLSGGEKRRLQLLRVLMENPNFLILDEPTNDLDIETLKILENFIDEYNGVVIVVSHDRYFLDRICNKIFKFDGKGNISTYHGNYSDYLNSYSDIEDEKVVNNKDIKEQKKVSSKNTSEKAPKFSFNEKKEFEEIEDVIFGLESDSEELEKEIQKNATNYSVLQELIEKKEELEMTILEKYERYEFLNNKAALIEEWKKNK
ncbi:ABC-F family ATP-binding cassette domain-containing protein [uncultured Clostridium sp.]|uniref:ABC-F family ATP-binding cassette domain-containing protein n=1 Tax=uncultured Clostridium sp. TaxID=59620 RepID=UPI002603A6C8|nr:ABC-F family ATP-binding cassette domain-containing protein [uncultured Clostridium sp.]